MARANLKHLLEDAEMRVQRGQRHLDRQRESSDAWTVRNIFRELRGYRRPEALFPILLQCELPFRRGRRA